LNSFSIINWLLVSVVVVVVGVVRVRTIANAVATPATANSTESTPMIVISVLDGGATGIYFFGIYFFIGDLFIY
jgi:hypothetical protein